MAEEHPRFLLLQARDAGDPMALHEQQCFADALDVALETISAHDLLQGPPGQGAIESHDALLVGGSGDYSVLGDHTF
ncbi:MAG: hypothetical protein QF464_07980, partial [Myxococcota bacterium]|nr:hypothetical protein [Myxococcota bacterium]